MKAKLRWLKNARAYLLELDGKEAILTDIELKAAKELGKLVAVGDMKTSDINNVPEFKEK